MPNYDEPGLAQPIITSNEPQIEEIVEQPENSVEDLSDLTKVTKEDILGKHDGNSDPESMERDIDELTTISDDEMDDLFSVSKEDMMGRQPKPRKRYRIMPRRVNNQPPSMGGMSY